MAKLKYIDVYSLMLFAMFKLRDIPEYASLSEMVYILDKDSLLKLCEYFGGLTIKIPTIEELESIRNKKFIIPLLIMLLAATVHKATLVLFPLLIVAVKSL